MRKLGIDYGDARIGLALTDPTNTIASAYEVYKTRGWSKDVAYLCALATEKQVDLIVMGDPINMDGSMGNRCEVVRQFGQRLHDASGLEIVYVDERHSTVDMHEFLDSQGIPKKRQKEYVDKLSAQWILKSYLDAEELKAVRGKI